MVSATLPPTLTLTTLIWPLLAGPSHRHWLTAMRSPRHRPPRLAIHSAVDASVRDAELCLRTHMLHNTLYADTDRSILTMASYAAPPLANTTTGGALAIDFVQWPAIVATPPRVLFQVWIQPTCAVSVHTHTHVPGCWLRLIYCVMEPHLTRMFRFRVLRRGRSAAVCFDLVLLNKFR